MKKRDKKAQEKETTTVRPSKLGSLAQKNASKEKPSLVDRLFGKNKTVPQ